MPDILSEISEHTRKKYEQLRAKFPRFAGLNDSQIFETLAAERIDQIIDSVPANQRGAIQIKGTEK